MNTHEIKQQKVREILLKYTLPDALKPEYDGMTAWELAGIIIKEGDEAEKTAGIVGFEEFTAKETMAGRGDYGMVDHDCKIGDGTGHCNNPIHQEK